jgi:hypothetical protein
MNIFIEQSKLNGFISLLKLKEIQVHKCIRQGLEKIGLLVQGEARKNAPRLHGDLERSISYEVHDDYVKVFVPINSTAGKYAWKREYEEYELGEVSLAKGQAGNHFIQRAIDTNKDRIKLTFNQILGKL